MTPLLLALQLILAFGVPALIAMKAPARWRVLGLLGWTLSPLILFLLVLGIDAVRAPPAPEDLGKLFVGLGLIASVVALPWLLACLVGFGLGVMLRKRMSPVREAQPAASVAQPVAPDTSLVAGQAERPGPAPATPAFVPTLAPPWGWHAVHVGFDHDELVLDGLPVWSLPWRESSAPPVMLAHPAHPQELHEFRIYDVDDGTQATRFAAAELSNTAWGFYRWVVPADAAMGQSADGSLRYAHSLGDLVAGRYDAVAPVATLQDAATGKTLFDGAAWSSSRVVPQDRGGLLLVLAHKDRQSIFRIDPFDGSFRDLATPGPDRPLAGLSAAAATALAEHEDPANTYVSRHIAPDGSLLVDLQWVEWSNTHWVRSPRVTQIATGRSLLDLWGSDWDADVGFPRTQAVRLSLRRYHVGGGLEAEIDLQRAGYTIWERPNEPSHGLLAQLAEALEAASHRTAAAVPPGPQIPPKRATPGSLAVALLILVGALLAIAGTTFVVERLKPRPARGLDRIPPMPVLPSARSPLTQPVFPSRPATPPR